MLVFQVLELRKKDAPEEPDEVSGRQFPIVPRIRLGFYLLINS
jgi:hypothetical protein